jgi:parvulin-like peptidyl-prolyl isomerase
MEIHTPRNRRPSPVLQLALPLAALLAALPACRAAAADSLNRVVLRVNDQIATLYDYERRRDEAVREITARVRDSKERQQALDTIGETVFRDMFQELLLSSRADQIGIEVNDAEVDQAIANLKVSSGIKTEQDLQQALAQANITLDQLRAQTRRNLRIHDALGKEVQSKIKVKDEDLRRYYRKNQDQFQVPEQLQLREVVVLDDGGLPEPERRRVAAAIKAAVAGGKSLSDAVASYAAAGQTSNVVELGWISAKDLDPVLEAAAWKLGKDGLTDPVAARGGLHLLQLIDRHPAHLRPFSEVQAQIQSQETERIFQEESTKYIADLETKSLVVADPPQEAANFRRKIGIGGGETLQGVAAAAATPAAGADPSGQAAGSTGQATTAAGQATPPAAAPTVDASDRKSKGLPAPSPVGAPAKDPLAIPPPAPNPPPPASPPGV